MKTDPDRSPIRISQTDRNYILAGNYQLLDAVIADANKRILLLEKRLEKMLESKKKQIDKMKKVYQQTNKGWHWQPCKHD